MDANCNASNYCYVNKVSSVASCYVDVDIYACFLNTPGFPHTVKGVHILLIAKMPFNFGQDIGLYANNKSTRIV